ncbi:MAG: ATP-binding protein [Acidobacteriota bacterium]|nr:ATP-binding protein [Acidobacteriota bacterium]
MSNFTKEDLEGIINSNNFDKLKGKYESARFECKSQPYLLGDNKNKREIAKDVSSFANTDGGYILIGVKTIKDVTHIGDRIDEIKPFDSNLINKEQVSKVCEDWIYPKPEGLDFFWITSSNDANKGIAVIKIPSQSDRFKPFLIKNVLDEEKQVEIMFGYAVRVRDNSQPYSLRDLQTLLRSGLNYEQTIQKRFEVLELKIESIKENDNSESLYERIDRLTKIAVSEADLAKDRFFALTAFTDKPNNLKSFATSENGAKILLGNTPSLRYGGWTLDTHNRPEIIKGELIRAKEDDYKTIELHRDGTLIFAGAADGRFLSWGKKWGDNDKINQVALIEIIFNFVELYQKVALDLEEKPQNGFIRIELSNMHKGEIKNYLAPYQIDYWATSRDVKVAPDDSMIKIVKFDFDNFTSGQIAFKVLREIYLWFGFDEGKIPYSKTENESRMVDPEQIKNLN